MVHGPSAQGWVWRLQGHQGLGYGWCEGESSFACNKPSVLVLSQHLVNLLQADIVLELGHQLTQLALLDLERASALDLTRKDVWCQRRRQREARKNALEAVEAIAHEADADGCLWEERGRLWILLLDALKNGSDA